MKESPGSEPLGSLITAFVNRVAHGQGRTLALMSDASVTLPQVLLLRRMQLHPDLGVAELAAAMRMSRPAMSQMLERLVRLGLVSRLEAEEDRRKKRLAVTPAARTLLRRLERARSGEYEAGVAALSATSRARLAAALRAALADLDAAEGLAPDGT